MQRTTVITSVHDLKRHYGFQRLFNYPRNVEIQIPQLEEADTQHYRQMFNRFSAECGCDKGKVFITIFVLSYVVGAVFFSWKTPTQYHLLNGFLFAFVGAVIGKLYGLVINNINIQQAIKALEIKLNHE